MNWRSAISSFVQIFIRLQINRLCLKVWIFHFCKGNVTLNRFTFLSMLFAVVPFSASAKSFQRILTCDNGAAHIDVDQDDRQSVQLVISDQKIVDYLGKTYVQDSEKAGLYWGNKFVAFSTYFSRPNEILAAGRAQNGIFSPADFETASGVTAEGNYFRPAELSIRREGHGIKVAAFRSELILTRQCGYDANWQPSFCYDHTAPYLEFINWTFQTCE